MENDSQKHNTQPCVPRQMYFVLEIPARLSTGQWYFIHNTTCHQHVEQKQFQLGMIRVIGTKHFSKDCSPEYSFLEEQKFATETTVQVTKVSSDVDPTCTRYTWDGYSWTLSVTSLSGSHCSIYKWTRNDNLLANEKIMLMFMGKWRTDSNKTIGIFQWSNFRFVKKKIRVVVMRLHFQTRARVQLAAKRFHLRTQNTLDTLSVLMRSSLTHLLTCPVTQWPCQGSGRSPPDRPDSGTLTHDSCIEWAVCALSKSAAPIIHDCAKQVWSIGLRSDVHVSVPRSNKETYRFVIEFQMLTNKFLFEMSECHDLQFFFTNSALSSVINCCCPRELIRNKRWKQIINCLYDFFPTIDMKVMKFQANSIAKFKFFVNQPSLRCTQSWNQGGSWEVVGGPEGSVSWPPRKRCLLNSGPQKSPRWSDPGSAPDTPTPAASLFGWWLLTSSVVTKLTPESKGQLLTSGGGEQK